MMLLRSLLLPVHGEFQIAEEISDSPCTREHSARHDARTIRGFRRDVFGVPWRSLINDSEAAGISSKQMDGVSACASLYLHAPETGRMLWGISWWRRRDPAARQIKILTVNEIEDGGGGGSRTLTTGIF